MQQDQDVLNFMKSHAPDVRRSKLDDFCEQILFLKQQGYSDALIVQFLEEKKQVKISRQRLGQWLKTKTQANNSTQQNTTKPSPKSFPVIRKTSSNKQPEKQQQNKEFSLIQMSDDEMKDWLS